MNTFLSVLGDFSVILMGLLAGFAGGWLACSIFAGAKLRRIRVDTWTEASRYYMMRFHKLVSKR